MDLNRLTQKSQQALQSAQSLAIEYQNQQLEQSHLLWALCADGEGLIPELLKKMGVDGARVADAARAEVAKLPHCWPSAPSSFSPRAASWTPSSTPPTV